MRKWGYLIILVIAWGLYLAMPKVVLFSICLFLTCLPILSYCFFFIERRSTKISLHTTKQVLTKNDEATFELIYERTSPLPFNFLQAKIISQNRFLEHITEQLITIPIDQKKNKVSFTYSCTQIGVIEMQISSIIYQDFLFLWQKEIAIKMVTEICVFPYIIKVDTYFAQSVNALLTEAYQQSKKRVEHNDDYLLREYLPTDQLRHIHYKISYKMHKYFVRDFLYDDDQIISCYLDLRGNETIIEQTISTFYNLAAYCFKQHIKLLAKTEHNQAELTSINALEQYIYDILANKQTPSPALTNEYDCIIHGSEIY